MTVSKETYFEVMECYGYRCVECFTSEGVELCHRLPNYDRYKKKFPLFLNSPFNLIPRCGLFGKNCHKKFDYKYKITEREAEMFERYLTGLKELKCKP